MDNLPTWDKIWDDFIQEETQRGLMQGNSSTSRKYEENLALISKGKKKFKKVGPRSRGTEEGNENCKVIFLLESQALCWTVPTE